MKNIFLFLISIFSSSISFSQQKGYWQQHVNYKMNVNMDVKTYLYSGNQELVYTNNSNDTLRKVFYHLFYNAFQPNSEMDKRLQSIKDPDGRMVDKIKIDDKDIKESRIAKLKPNEIGFLHVKNIKQDGILVTSKEMETIVEVTLAKPLLPNTKTTLTLDFEGQVPVHIRRAGRNNNEGIALSMAQWYPKMAEFDFEGWHADPYISREFHGVWGNFDVNITIDKNYILGGTGTLVNKNEVGHHYQDENVEVKIPRKQKTVTWHFNAPNVHDFTWAADPDYIHDKKTTADGITIHFLYKNNSKIIENWKIAEDKTVQLMEFYNKTVGKYPYDHYSVIQGGDGGMEYAMCTLILGEGKLDGLVGVIAHEMAHAWFQGVLATNESKHPWMDEGFTSYLEDLGLNEIAEEKKENPFTGSYIGYNRLVESGKEQPLSTHGDRYDENRSYSIASYSKGELFLTQLEYLIGKENVLKTLKRYFNEFKFKHPTPNDIKRTAERITGANLDWYLVDWTQTTNTIDYAIKSVEEKEATTIVSLERIGRMPMPIDLLVEYTDGSKECFLIPLQMMNYTKNNPTPQIKRTIAKNWAWGNPSYELSLNNSLRNIKSITIDSSNLMADIKKDNNLFKSK